MLALAWHARYPPNVCFDNKYESRSHFDTMFLDIWVHQLTQCGVEVGSAMYVIRLTMGNRIPANTLTLP